MIDGSSSYWMWDDKYDMYFKTSSLWKADSLDANPTIELKFGQRCLINKINLYFGTKISEDDPTVINLPKGYRLQYWNNSFWVDIANVTGDPTGSDIPNPEPIHQFDAVETSAVRMILTPGYYFSGYVREIEVWGNM